MTYSKKGFKKLESNIWKPTEEGDALEGEIVHIDDSGVYGLTVRIEKADGSQVNTPFHRALQNRLRTANLKIGDTIAIVYTHSEKSKKGSDTMLYDIYVKE